MLPKGDAKKTEEELEEDDEEELDDTLSERLWGLMEMFPEVWSVAGATIDFSLLWLKKCTGFPGCLVDWEHFLHDSASSCCL